MKNTARLFLTVIALTAINISLRATAKEKLAELTVVQEMGDRFLRHQGAVTGAAISPDGKYLASVGSDALIRIWDLQAKKEARQIRTEGVGRIYGLVYSPDGKTFVTGAGGGSITQWDATTGKKIRDLDGSGLKYPVCRFSPNGKEIIAASRWGDGGLKVLDLNTGKVAERFQANTTTVNSFDISPDGKLLVTGDRFSKNGVRLWDFTTCGLKQTYSIAGNGVGQLAFSRDGKRIAAINRSENPSCYVWATKSAKQVAKFNLKGWYTGMVFSKDGKRLLCSTYQGELREFDAKTGKALRTISRLGPISNLGLAPNGERLFGSGYDGAVRVIDARTLATVDFSKTSLPGAISCHLTDDDKTLITTHRDSAVRVWDLTGKGGCRLLEISGHPANVDVSPDGEQVLVSASKGALELWDLARGKRIRTYLFPTTHVVAAQFSHDGKRAYVAQNGTNHGDAGMVVVLDLETGDSKKIPQLDKQRMIMFLSGRRNRPKRDVFFIAQEKGGSVWDLQNQIRYYRIVMPQHLFRGDISWDYKHAVIADRYPYGQLQYFQLPGIDEQAKQLPEQQIEALVRRLGADSFRDRRQAQKSLTAAGLSAIPVLEKAVEDDDPEIRTRAESILKGIRDREALSIGPTFKLSFADQIKDANFQPKGTHWIAALGPKEHAADKLVFGTVHKEEPQLRVSQRVALKRYLNSFVVNHAGTKIIALNADTTITVYGIPKTLQAPRKAKAKE